MILKYMLSRITEFLNNLYFKHNVLTKENRRIKQFFLLIQRSNSYYILMNINNPYEIRCAELSEKCNPISVTYRSN